MSDTQNPILTSMATIFPQEVTYLPGSYGGGPGKLKICVHVREFAGLQICGFCGFFVCESVSSLATLALRFDGLELESVQFTTIGQAGVQGLLGFASFALS